MPVDSIIFIVIFAVIGVGLGVLFNLFVIKKGPEKGRKGNYVKTIIIFLLTAVVISALVQARSIAVSTVNEYSTALEQSIKKDYSNIGFVRNGLNLSGINNNAEIARAVADIQAILPSHADLDISKGLYDIVANPIMKQLQSTLTDAAGSNKLSRSFADENNVITVSSILNRMKKNIMNVVNVVVLIFAAIFTIIFLNHVIKSLTAVSKEKKRAESSE